MWDNPALAKMGQQYSESSRPHSGVGGGGPEGICCGVEPQYAQCLLFESHKRSAQHCTDVHWQDYSHPEYASLRLLHYIQSDLICPQKMIVAT